ncbi:ABC transporter permease [Jeotgalicoccus sp. FSL K6-3177]|uniref:ABC transporter permease n=1 Tax=Jeotgalicoccus sp. FSL K6-3177 TaxID=2921494 RepID=UPI0030FDC18C
MIKILKIIGVYINILTVYRFQFISNFIVQLFQLILVIFIWEAIYTGNTQNIQGYTKNDMITYIFLVTFIGIVMNISFIFRQAKHIKDGQLSHFLIRPLSYILDLFSIFISQKIIELLIFILVISLLIALNVIDDLNFSWYSLLYFPLSLILFFYFCKAFGDMTFWLVHVWPLKPLFNSLFLLFGGGFFPLDILPTALFSVLQYTPFALFGFVNIQIIMGEVSLSKFVIYIIVTVAWLVFFILLEKFLWNKGMKKYEGIGL